MKRNADREDRHDDNDTMRGERRGDDEELVWMSGLEDHEKDTAWKRRAASGLSPMRHDTLKLQHLLEAELTRVTI
jgi:hypothetical protein